MKLYNLINCKGFIESNEKLSMDIGGPCSSAKLILVALFFINAFIRKWGGEEVGLDYNFWGGLIGSMTGYIILITFTGKLGLSFIVGLIAMLIGGYGSTYILELFGIGGGSDYD